MGIVNKVEFEKWFTKNKKQSINGVLSLMPILD